MPEKNPAGGLPCRPAIELRIGDRLYVSTKAAGPQS
jgi:hypothetical protein